MSHTPIPSWPSGPARLAWVDYARGLGIFLVVVGHTLRGALNAGLLTPSAAIRFVDDWIYAFHMPLFFFISGLFAERSAAKGTTRFVADKLRTIAYPYVVWSLLQAGAQLLLVGYTNSQARWQDLASIAYRPPMQFWFLYTLLLCFFLFLMVWKAGLGRWGLLATALSLIAVQAQIGLGSWGVLYQLSANLPYFALGVVGSRSVQNVIPTVGRRTGAVVTGLGYGLMTLAIITDKTALRIPAALLGTTATLACAALLARSRLVACVRLWGESSMPIFLAHTLASAGFRIVLQKGAGVSDHTVHIVGGVAVGLYAPILLTLVARRVGFDYLFSWPERARTGYSESTHPAGSPPGLPQP